MKKESFPARRQCLHLFAFATFFFVSICPFTYAAEDIELSIQITSPLNTPEFGSATALEAFCPSVSNAQTDEQSDLSIVCNFYLDTTQGTPEQKTHIAEELSAKNATSNNTGIVRPGFSSGLNGVSNRLAALRRGTKAVSKSLLSYSSTLESLSKNANSSDDIPGGLLSNRLSAYVNFSNASGSYFETNTEAGFDNSNRGVLLGIDYRLHVTTFIGIASHYTSSQLDLKDPGSEISANQYQLLVYGSHFLSDNWYLQLALQGAKQNIDMTRSINLQINNPVNAIAKANTTGNQLGVNFSTGYNHQITKGYNVGVVASVNYVSSKIQAYDEKGAPGFNLNVNEQNIPSLTSELNGNVSTNYAFSWGLLFPQLSVTWIHEFEQSGDTISAKFLSDPNSTPFSFTTQKADPNFFVFGANLQALFTRGRSAFVSFNSIQKLRDRKHWAAMLGYRMEF